MLPNARCRTRSTSERQPRRARAAAPDAPVLPTPALKCVLSHCDGDVRTLCAAACVSRAWRDAAAEQTLWCVLSGLCRCAPLRSLRPPHAALADAGVANLVSRAGPGAAIELLDAYQCAAVTVDGLLQALAGRLITRELRVRGVSSRARSVSGALLQSRDPLPRLRALLAPGARMDATELCQYETGTWRCEGILCARPDDVSCDDCDAVWCHLCVDKKSCEQDDFMCRHQRLAYAHELRCDMCHLRDRSDGLKCEECRKRGCGSCIRSIDGELYWEKRGEPVYQPAFPSREHFRQTNDQLRDRHFCCTCASAIGLLSKEEHGHFYARRSEDEEWSEKNGWMKAAADSFQWRKVAWGEHSDLEEEEEEAEEAQERSEEGEEAADEGEEEEEDEEW